MRKKSIKGLLCLLMLVVLGGCGKAKVESASTEENIPVEETEQTETINNTDDTEEENTEAAEELIPETYAFSCKVTINPEIELYLNQKNEIVGFEYLNEDAKDAYQKLALKGLTVEAGVKEMILAASEKGYLDTNKKVSITITEVKDTTCDTEAVCEKIKEAAQEVIAEEKIEAELEVADYESENAVPQNPCTACGGTGKCQECKGDGYRGSGYSVSCPRCHGALTETCIYCDANGNSTKHEGICDFPNCMGAHVYACTICGGGTKPVTCESCGGSGACNVCGGSGSL